MPPLTEQLQALIAQFPEVLSRVALAALILLLAVLISTWLGRAVAAATRRREADATLQVTLQRLTRWGILLLGGLLAVEQVVPNVTSLLAGLGIAGFTIGFALQDVAKNFIAGLLLLLQQPFDLGDTIEVAGFTGEVESIELRTTDLRAIDGRFVTIPNADVLASPIINYSRAPARRLEITVPVAYGADLNAARQVALQAIRQVNGVLAEPDPQVAFRALGDSYLQLGIQYWADMKRVDYFDALDDGVRRLESSFSAAGIDIAPPATISLQDSESG